MQTKNISLKDLPSPKGKFILGHLPEFKTDQSHLVLENWVKECGPLFQINFVGKPFIVSADPKINEQILKLRPSKFKRYHKINEILEEMGVIGVFNAEGDTWKQHRKITSEALNLKNVKRFFPVVQKCTEILFEKWKNLSSHEITFDVQKEMMLYTVDVTTEIAFGKALNTMLSPNNEIQEHLSRIFPAINKRITAPLPVWRWIKSKEDKELDKSIQFIENLVHEFIKEARERFANNPQLKSNPTNFLEALLVEQEKEGSFTDEEVYGNVFSMLLAGEDTTSNSISWSIYYLLKHPEVLKKIKEETEMIIGEKAFPTTYEEMLALKYTESVALETLRIKPVTPNLYMEALEDIELDGLMVKKGQTIMLQNKVPQTEEAYFTNASQFNPERWQKGGCPMHVTHNPSIVRAFGAGPRFCPGKALAINEMVMVLSMLCKNFSFSPAKPLENVKEVFNFTMYPVGLELKI